MKKIIVSGTGHRPNKLGGYSTHSFTKLVNIAKEWLIENKTEYVISGMALGWDMALAQASIECDIPLLCAIPFKGQELKWSDEQQLQYKKILRCAFKIVVVCDGEYHPKKMQIRNEWMVDNSNTILAMWDGSAGGTYNCINYANKKRNKNIINLYEKWKTI